jgi:hypothetical protein
MAVAGALVLRCFFHGWILFVVPLPVAEVVPLVLLALLALSMIIDQRRLVIEKIRKNGLCGFVFENWEIATMNRHGFLVLYVVLKIPSFLQINFQIHSSDRIYLTFDHPLAPV